MRLVPVTTCTDRKRFSVPEELCAANLPSGDQATVAMLWRNRVALSPDLAPARDVYCGRSFAEALEAARFAGGELWIISGGLGLIRGAQTIPAYSLSLASQSRDFVGARIRNGRFDPARWWREIQICHPPLSLAELVRSESDSVIAIATSNAYLRLVEADLLALDDGALERVRLIGMSIEGNCPDRLRPCILAYDDRLDGQDSPIRGTRADFSSRALRHFADRIFPGSKADLESHQAAVRAKLRGLRRPPKIEREPKSDTEIIELIKRAWQDIQGQSSRALRHLRDVENVACEQGRFRELFRRAAREVVR